MSTKNVDLQLRLKTNAGQFTLATLNGNDTVGKLKSEILAKTQLNVDDCKLLIGFPPEEIFLVDNDQLLHEIIKNKRETLTIEASKSNGGSSSNGNIVSQAPQPKPKREPLAPVTKQMKRIVVPANNSCLFVSVNYCMTGTLQEKCPQMRNLIAKTVQNDPTTYNDAFLEKSNSEYCKWICDEDHWGGGIELSILSSYYNVEIVAVDTQNTRLNRFGEDKNYPYRIFLIFDGIHYDALVLESSDPSREPTQTMFPSDQLEVFDLVLALAKEAKAKHQYTDLKRMQLKCNKCKLGFSQEDAREHASKTGHVDFSEFH